MGLENITGIKLCGANFETDTVLQIFASQKKPTMALVYGKNGSGKSTLSRSFSKAIGKFEDTISNAELLDVNSNVITLLESDKKNVYVFNEQYVDNNIKLRPDGQGLNTIVVLGKANDIEQDLKIAQKDVDEQQPKVDSQTKLCESFSDEKNIVSPLYYLKLMKDSLKGEVNWSGRDSRIKGNTRSTPIKDDTYLSFVSKKPIKLRDELIIEFEEKMKKLTEARSGIKRIDKAIRTEGYLSFDKNKYLEILKKKIERPELSEREEFLLTLGQEQPQRIKNYFEKKENTRCPYCLQTLTDDYKIELFESIKKALSKAAEEHQKELEKYKRDTISFDFTPYEELSALLLKDSEDKLELLNNCIDIINENIQNKINDVYTPIEKASCDILSKYEDFINSLKKIEASRVEYNKNASETESIVKDLNRINADIASYDLQDNYKKYIDSLKQEEKSKVDLGIFLEEMNRRKTVLEKLKEQKRDAKIALRKINNNLNYIFFSKDRLSIEMIGEQYFLKSRGKSVSPSKVSVGERNAVALCYFFSELMREQKEEEILSKEYLFVIDDPVSSFDMENRVGILSFFKSQLSRFVKGNNSTKVLLLTHDIQTAYDIEKIYAEITDSFNIHSRDREKYTKVYELINNALTPYSSNGRNEYTSLMVNTYAYIKGENENYELIVGNSMRRIMEAFSTFLYKKSIEQISTDPQILKKLEEPVASHFENLMYRLVLHGGSHNEERVKSMVSEDFFDYISSDEKKRTAKEILCFLYLLDERHVLEHLKKDNSGQPLPDVQRDLSIWKEELRNLLIIEEH